MNAKEARALTKANEHKPKDKLLQQLKTKAFNELYEKVEKEIKKKAEEGYSSCTVKVTMPHLAKALLHKLNKNGFVPLYRHIWNDILISW